jgi:hypothetical protein
VWGEKLGDDQVLILNLHPAHRGLRPRCDASGFIVPGSPTPILEARDLNHAVELISKHPGAKFDPWEIRPAANRSEVVRQSEVRRRQPGKPQG